MSRARKRPISVAITGPHSDGRYHAKKVVGRKPDGSPDRRHMSGKTYEEVEDKVRELEDELTKRGRVAPAGSVPTVEEWYRTWMNSTVCDLEWKSIQYYKWAGKHILAGLGQWRLDELTGPVVQDFYRSCPGRGLNSGSVSGIHRTLRALVNEAIKQDVLLFNPLKAVRPPENTEEEVTPLFLDEVRKIVAVCDKRLNGTRWTVAMPLGLRQGEALGLTWWVEPKSTRDTPMGVNLETGFVKIMQKATQRTWEHGCKDPIACVKEMNRCATEPCVYWDHGCGPEPELWQPGECGKKVARACPVRRRGACRVHTKKPCPMCEPGCDQHAKHCPRRKNGGIVYSRAKSKAGERRVALSPEMLARLLRHKTEQDAARSKAGSAWHDNNLVWCYPTGKPIDSRRDWGEWKEILKLAGVRDARVHDGRHTAATMLLLQGVDSRTVMEVMGWSSQRMLQRYQHVVDELRLEASRRVGDLIFGDGSGNGSEKPSKKKKKKKKKRQPEDLPRSAPVPIEVLESR